jgi:hypothetical protein
VQTASAAAEAVDSVAALVPLFSTVIAPPQCRFEPADRKPLEQQINHLAATSESSQQFQNPPEGLASQLWQATATQLSCWIKPLDRANEQQLRSDGSAMIRQLLVRPQGCFVVTERSLDLWRNPELTSRLQIFAWDQASAVAVDPQGNWVALLMAASGSQTQQFSIQRLSSRRALTQPTSITTSIEVNGEWLTMLALDSRHLALFWNGSQRNWRVDPQSAQATSQDDSNSTTSNNTTMALLTRRGNQLGRLNLPLGLRQVSLTHRPYRLLATDECSGTVLLLDLKPYRIKRLWVGISPQFWVAADWGYVLAEPSGSLVFLDQAGQQIGKLSCPPQITALALWQDQLWIATWDLDQGSLYRLNLPDLGLDLVF